MLAQTMLEYPWQRPTSKHSNGGIHKIGSKAHFKQMHCCDIFCWGWEVIVISQKVNSGCAYKLLNQPGYQVIRNTNLSIASCLPNYAWIDALSYPNGYQHKQVNQTAFVTIQLIPERAPTFSYNFQSIQKDGDDIRVRFVPIQLIIT